MPFPMNEEQAMLFIVYTSESFWSLPWDQMTLEQQTGVILFLENSLMRAMPLIPRIPEMQHVFDAVEQMRKISGAIREFYDIEKKV